MVMVMLPIGERDLEPCDPVADLNALDKPECGQGVEDAIDAGDTDLATGGADSVEDLLRRAAASLIGEVVDNRAAGAALPQPRVAKAVEGMFTPGGDHCHIQMIPILSM